MPINTNLQLDGHLPATPNPSPLTCWINVRGRGNGTHHVSKHMLSAHDPVTVLCGICAEDTKLLPPSGWRSILLPNPRGLQVLLA